MSGDPRAFALALEHGVDSIDAQGNTALIASAFVGNASLVKELLGAKADISKANDTGCCATWVAAAYGKAEVLKELLACGGNALACNKQACSYICPRCPAC
jgi:ankyrin repeat protein